MTGSRRTRHARSKGDPPLNAKAESLAVPVLVATMPLPDRLTLEATLTMRPDLAESNVCQPACWSVRTLKVPGRTLLRMWRVFTAAAAERFSRGVRPAPHRPCHVVRPLGGDVLLVGPGALGGRRFGALGARAYGARGQSPTCSRRQVLAWRKQYSVPLCPALELRQGLV